jgi:hypothetical protein
VSTGKGELRDSCRETTPRHRRITSSASGEVTRRTLPQPIKKLGGPRRNPNYPSPSLNLFLFLSAISTNQRKLAGVPNSIVDSDHPLDHGVVQQVHRGSRSFHLEGIIRGRREYCKFVISLSSEYCKFVISLSSRRNHIDQALKLGRPFLHRRHSQVCGGLAHLLHFLNHLRIDRSRFPVLGRSPPPPFVLTGATPVTKTQGAATIVFLVDSRFELPY